MKALLCADLPEWRKSQGRMSQAQLAVKLGVSVKTIQRLEADGGTLPRLYVLALQTLAGDDTKRKARELAADIIKVCT